MQEHETFTCEWCRQEHPISECIIYDGGEFCRHCYEEEMAVCDCCGQRGWREDMEEDDYTSLCLSCYERHYTRCTDCGQIIHYDAAFFFDNNDEYAYCSHCFSNARQARQKIHGYGYKPLPIFYGEGTRYFGVELELDEGGEEEDNAVDLLQIANEFDERMYCKHDGSLEDGFELVTHPMTLDYHRNEMCWQTLTETAVQMGYRSHQAGTCGLHIHVNRNSFGPDEETQEASIGRVLFFVENHWNELLRFSRRTQRQMEQWAARYGRKDSPKEQMEHVKKQYGDRYRAVNLSNAATIEFRMFRGTLRHNTLIATLQLVNEICEVATFLSDEEMAQLTWSDFMARINTLNYPELVQYLKERRLYISEPVAGEEEL